MVTHSVFHFVDAAVLALSQKDGPLEVLECIQPPLPVHGQRVLADHCLPLLGAGGVLRLVLVRQVLVGPLLPI